MKEQERVSRMRRAWVQKRMTGFRISGVFSTNDLMELGTVFNESMEASSSVASSPEGSVVN